MSEEKVSGELDVNKIFELQKQEEEYMQKLCAIEEEFIKLDEYSLALNNKIDEINREREMIERTRLLLVFKLDSLKISITDVFKNAQARKSSDL